MSDPRADAAFLGRNAAAVHPKAGLAERLAAASVERRPLRVKFGMDPTAPDIHLGHAVVLQKLREFQDLGHLVVLVVGDYTARVGDPSGRSAIRPVLTGEQIDRNAATYRRQAGRVLREDPELLEVRHNREWLDMPMERFLELARIPKVAHLLERDDFARRLATGRPISLLEFVYPLLQGYDSVAVDADVEIGGTDQTFNLLFGRDVQRAHAQREQAVLTMPLLVGVDGEQKMSKSLGNQIGVTDPPDEIFGRTMSIPDESIESWSELLGLCDPFGATDTGPRDRKRALGRALCDRFAGDGSGVRAQERFDRLFGENRVPDEVATHGLDETADPVHLPALIAAAFGVSRSEARRAVAQGGVRIDARVVGPETLDVPRAGLDGSVLRLGKRRFVRLVNRR